MITRRSGRRPIWAGSLALCAALLAAPVAATDGSNIDSVAAVERAAFDLSASEQFGQLIARYQLLVESDAVEWSVLLPDPEVTDLTAHAPLAAHAGNEDVTPSGVEWTWLSASDPSGVEWTRLRFIDADGSSWTRTLGTDPAGVEWTFVTFQGAYRASWVESRFVDGDVRAWSRIAPGTDLGGVEWT